MKAETQEDFERTAAFWILLDIKISVYKWTHIKSSVLLQGKFLYLAFSYEGGVLTSKKIDPNGSYDTASWLERVIVIGLHKQPTKVSVNSASEYIVCLYISVDWWMLKILIVCVITSVDLIYSNHNLQASQVMVNWICWIIFLACNVSLIIIPSLFLTAVGTRDLESTFESGSATQGSQLTIRKPGVSMREEFTITIH